MTTLERAWALVEAELAGTGHGWSVAADGPGYVARVRSNAGVLAESWSACDHGLMEDDEPCGCRPSPADALLGLVQAYRDRRR